MDGGAGHPGEVDAECCGEFAVGSAWCEEEAQAGGDSHSPEGLVGDGAQSGQGGLCSEVIWTVKARNAELLLELKSEGEFGIGNGIPKERKQDSFHVEECGTILDHDS